MLIRGQTTEQRIAEIANAFKQGVDGYSAGQRRFNDAQKEENRYQEARSLQDEAKRRQEALQAFEVENKIAEQTGRNAIGSGIGQKILKGEYPDPKVFGELGLSRKAELEAQDRAARAEDRAINREYRESQIKKNNNSLTAPPLSYEQKLDLKIRKEQEAKAIEKKDPTYKLEKLGAEGRSKVGALASGLQALDQMEKASSDGYGPEYIDANTSLIGGLVSDTPYSEGERMTSEVIGRLQSGGAIQAEEIKTFRALGPRPGDDAPTRKRKLAQQKDFLQNKLTAFGVSTDDMGSLGFKTISDYSPRNAVTQGVSTQQAAPMVNQQQVNTVKAMSDEELLKFVQGG